MKIFMILLFALINVISAALIPRGASNALRSNLPLQRFPLKNDKMLVSSPRRMMSNKAGTDNIPAKPNYFMKGIIAGMSLSTALATTYLLTHEDLLSSESKKKLHEYEVKLAKMLMDDDMRTIRDRCFEAITNSNTLDFEKYCLSKAYDINYTDDKFVTAMELAIKLGRSQFIVPLLRAGVNIKIRDRQRRGYLEQAIETRNEEVLKELLTVEHTGFGVAGRYHLQQAIEEGNVDMVKAWIRGGINEYYSDTKGRNFLVTAILNHQRGSFDAILDSKFPFYWDFQNREILRTIMEESRKATSEESSKMNYPEMIARFYVKCNCDHKLYEYIESLGVSKEELDFLKQIEPISCRKRPY